MKKSRQEFRTEARKDREEKMLRDLYAAARLQRYA
jgi:hypothetical protein